MSFLAPLWLAGLAALLVPIALHLLGRGRPPSVALGSVRLLTAGAVRVPQRVRLQRPWLLLLRCALLAVLAFALAGPRLRAGAGGGGPPPTWVLIEPGLPADAVAAAMGAPAGDDAAADDAKAAPAVEKRWLAPGLPPLTAPASGTALPDPAAVPGGVWSLLREAAAVAPPGATLRVVTAERLAALRGERPALGRKVDWRVVPDERVNRWPAAVVDAGPGGSVAVGESDRERTRFLLLPLPGGRGAGEAGSGGDSRGAGKLPPTDPARRPASPRTCPSRSTCGAAPSGWPSPTPSPTTAKPPLPTGASRRVLVASAPGRETDAGYVAAGLRAAAAQAALALELVTTGSDAESAAGEPGGVSDGADFAGADLAFWLADEPPPAALLAAVAKGATLVTDAARGEEECPGFLVFPSGPPVRWLRCAGTAEAPTPPPLWRSDRGRQLLVAEPLGEGRVLRLAGRFHPAWSELVLSPAFPEWLLGLLGGGATGAELPASDRRGAGGQGAPALAGSRAAGDETAAASGAAAGAAPEVPAPAPPPSPAPERILWAALPALVVVERWLAGRNG